MGYLANSLRGASRGPDEPLNILTSPTHERWESSLALTGHRFWAVRAGNVKDWNASYAPVPDNYHVLSRDAMPPDHVTIDLVLAQNRFGQYQLLEPLARRLHAPLATVEHTTVMPTWPAWYVEKMKAMRGHANAFITATSRKAWGWAPWEADVLPHGIDSGLFRPDDGPRRPVLLSVVNDWINRDVPCGYRYWQEATTGLPVRPVGNTPGLSLPADGVGGLAEEYRRAMVFVNTSQHSPVPMALLEAMSSGCAVVSAATCEVPEVITDGVNGLLCRSPAEMRAKCSMALADPSLCERLGREARKTVQERFSMERFVDNWGAFLRRAAKAVPYQDGGFV